jgi:hypothetical protein
MLSEETSLLAFKAICNFISDLSEEYGKRHKPLQLYKRLSSHTQISHDKAIRKHISIFQDFCVANREALTSQEVKKLVSKKIVYSERVYIDMEFIFHVADKENSQVIWQHLLIISALIDPAGKAKDILKKKAEEESKNEQNETNFLSEIISKVEKNVRPDSNPMEAFSSILQSGVANDLMSGMQGGLQSGKLDLKKLLGAVQGIVSNLESQAGEDSEAKKTMGVLNGVIGSLGNGDSPPDIGTMMSSMMALMSTMGAHSPSTAATLSSTISGVEDVTDSQVKKDT